MSNHLYRPAYATRLGNLTAKSVLVLLCDQANDDGLGWPSVASIVRGTEISRRTVLRILEVFASMNLIEQKRMEVSDRFGRRTVDAIQVDVSRLGSDLTVDFVHAYAAAQGKIAVAGRAGRMCLRDAAGLLSETRAEVSETCADVSETAVCVLETEPPDPLIGGPLFDPLSDPTLRVGSSDQGSGIRRQEEPEKPEEQKPEELPGDGLTDEQREHIEELRGKGRNADAAMWAGYYVDQNTRVAEANRAALDAAAADEAEAQREYPDLETALARMRKHCGFAWSEGDELGPVLRQVFADQLEMGKPVWRTARQMVSAWLLQRKQGRRLRARFGPMKFFRDGHWLDPAGWHWDGE
jgi:hypothetical protein